MKRTVLAAFVLVFALPATTRGQSLPPWAVEKLTVWYAEHNQGDAPGMTREHIGSSTSFPLELFSAEEIMRGFGDLYIGFRVTHETGRGSSGTCQRL